MNMEEKPSFFPSLKKTLETKDFENKFYIYFHFPICNNKCDYCSIPVHCRTSIEEEYLDILLKEFRRYVWDIGKEYIEGIHIGGGTPSILSKSQIKKVVSEIYNVLGRDDVEIVFEAHPLSLNNEKIDFLSQLKNVTLNIGVQTFDEKQLMNVNRNVKKDEMIKKIGYAQKKMRNMVGTDLIVGLPGASNKSVIRDLDTLFELGVNHISVYPLRIEKGSYLHTIKDNQKWEYHNKEKLIFIVKKVFDYLESKGYRRISVYEWEKEKIGSYGYSKHQRKGGEWIGIGAGAYSYYQRKICKNISSIERYIKASKNGHDIFEWCGYQNIISKVAWDISFALREGAFSKEMLSFRYGELIQKKVENIIESLCEFGYAKYSENDDKIYITANGIVDWDNVEMIVEKEVLKEKNASGL